MDALSRTIVQLDINKQVTKILSLCSWLCLSLDIRFRQKSFSDYLLVSHAISSLCLKYCAPQQSTHQLNPQ